MVILDDQRPQRQRHALNISHFLAYPCIVKYNHNTRYHPAKLRSRFDLILYNFLTPRPDKSSGMKVLICICLMPELAEQVQCIVSGSLEIPFLI